MGIDGSVIVENCRDRMGYIWGWFCHVFRGLDIAMFVLKRDVKLQLTTLEACRYDWTIQASTCPLKIALSYGGFGHWKTARTSREPFRILTHVGNSVLVRWAYWHDRVNMIKCSAVPYERQQCIRVQQCISMQQRLSLIPCWLHSSVTLNFFPIKIPLWCSISSKFFDHLLRLCDNVFVVWWFCAIY